MNATSGCPFFFVYEWAAIDPSRETSQSNVCESDVVRTLRKAEEDCKARLPTLARLGSPAVD